MPLVLYVGYFFRDWANAILLMMACIATARLQSDSNLPARYTNPIYYHSRKY